MSRIISKALPIRFWLNGQETFNEKTEPGVESHLWKQKWNLNDSVRLQVIDTDNRPYRVSIQDVDTGTQIGTKNFDKTEVIEEDYGTVLHYVNDVEFTMDELDVTDGQVVRAVLIAGPEEQPAPESLTIVATVSALLGVVAATISKIGHFVLNLEYGVTISDITPSGGQGLPAFAFAGADEDLVMTNLFTAGTTFSVDVNDSGAPPVSKNIAIYVNNVLKDVQIIPSAGMHTMVLTVSTAIAITDDVRITFGLA